MKILFCLFALLFEKVYSGVGNQVLQKRYVRTEGGAAANSFDAAHYCSLANDDTTCTGLGGCTWSIATSKCSSSDLSIQRTETCSDYTAMDPCNAETGCSWYSTSTTANPAAGKCVVPCGELSTGKNPCTSVTQALPYAGSQKRLEVDVKQSGTFSIGRSVFFNFNTYTVIFFEEIKIIGNGLGTKIVVETSVNNNNGAFNMQHDGIAGLTLESLLLSVEKVSNTPARLITLNAADAEVLIKDVKISGLNGSDDKGGLSYVIHYSKGTFTLENTEISDFVAKNTMFYLNTLALSYDTARYWNFLSVKFKDIVLQTQNGLVYAVASSTDSRYDLNVVVGKRSNADADSLFENIRVSGVYSAAGTRGTLFTFSSVLNVKFADTKFDEISAVNDNGVAIYHASIVFQSNYRSNLAICVPNPRTGAVCADFSQNDCPQTPLHPGVQCLWDSPFCLPCTDVGSGCVATGEATCADHVSQGDCDGTSGCGWEATTPPSFENVVFANNVGLYAGGIYSESLVKQTYTAVSFSGSQRTSTTTPNVYDIYLASIPNPQFIGTDFTGLTSTSCTPHFSHVLATVIGDTAVNTGPGCPTGVKSNTKLYVSIGGSDTSNDCDMVGSPCETLGHALSKGVDNEIQLNGATAVHAYNSGSTSYTVVLNDIGYLIFGLVNTTTLSLVTASNIHQFDVTYADLSFKDLTVLFNYDLNSFVRVRNGAALSLEGIIFTFGAGIKLVLIYQEGGSVKLNSVLCNNVDFKKGSAASSTFLYATAGVISIEISKLEIKDSTSDDTLFFIQQCTLSKFVLNDSSSFTNIDWSGSGTSKVTRGFVLSFSENVVVDDQSEFLIKGTTFSGIESGLGSTISIEGDWSKFASGSKPKITDSFFKSSHNGYSGALLFKKLFDFTIEDTKFVETSWGAKDWNEDHGDAISHVGFKDQTISLGDYFIGTTCFKTCGQSVSFLDQSSVTAGYTCSDTVVCPLLPIVGTYYVHSIGIGADDNAGCGVSFSSACKSLDYAIEKGTGSTINIYEGDTQSLSVHNLLVPNTLSVKAEEADGSPGLLSPVLTPSYLPYGAPLIIIAGNSVDLSFHSLELDFPTTSSGNSFVAFKGSCVNSALTLEYVGITYNGNYGGQFIVVSKGSVKITLSYTTVTTATAVELQKPFVYIEQIGENSNTYSCELVVKNSQFTLTYSPGGNSLFYTPNVVLNSTVSLEIKQSQFTVSTTGGRNYNYEYQGIIYSHPETVTGAISTTTITNSDFINVVGSSFGAVFSHILSGVSGPKFTDVKFSECMGNYAGALYVSKDSLELTRVTFESNKRADKTTGRSANDIYFYQDDTAHITYTFKLIEVTTTSCEPMILGILYGVNTVNATSDNNVTINTLTGVDPACFVPNPALDKFLFVANTGSVTGSDDYNCRGNTDSTANRPCLTVYAALSRSDSVEKVTVLAGSTVDFGAAGTSGRTGITSIRRNVEIESPNVGNKGTTKIAFTSTSSTAVIDVCEPSTTLTVANLSLEISYCESTDSIFRLYDSNTQLTIRDTDIVGTGRYSISINSIISFLSSSADLSVALHRVSISNFNTGVENGEAIIFLPPQGLSLDINQLVVEQITFSSDGSVIDVDQSSYKWALFSVKNSKFIDIKGPSAVNIPQGGNPSVGFVINAISNVDDVADKQLIVKDVAFRDIDAPNMYAPVAVGNVVPLFENVEFTSCVGYYAGGIYITTATNVAGVNVFKNVQFRDNKNGFYPHVVASDIRAESKTYVFTDADFPFSQGTCSTSCRNRMYPSIDGGLFNCANAQDSDGKPNPVTPCPLEPPELNTVFVSDDGATCSDSNDGSSRVQSLCSLGEALTKGKDAEIRVTAGNFEVAYSTILWYNKGYRLVGANSATTSFTPSFAPNGKDTVFDLEPNAYIKFEKAKIALDNVPVGSTITRFIYTQSASSSPCSVTLTSVVVQLGAAAPSRSRARLGAGTGFTGSLLYAWGDVDLDMADVTIKHGIITGPLFFLNQPSNVLFDHVEIDGIESSSSAPLIDLPWVSDVTISHSIFSNLESTAVSIDTGEYGFVLSFSSSYGGTKGGTISNCQFKSIKSGLFYAPLFVSTDQEVNVLDSTFTSNEGLKSGSLYLETETASQFTGNAFVHNKETTGNTEVDIMIDNADVVYARSNFENSCAEINAGDATQHIQKTGTSVGFTLDADWLNCPVNCVSECSDVTSGSCSTCCIANSNPAGCPVVPPTCTTHPSYALCCAPDPTDAECDAFCTNPANAGICAPLTPTCATNPSYALCCSTPGSADCSTYCTTTAPTDSQCAGTCGTEPSACSSCTKPTACVGKAGCVWAPGAAAASSPSCIDRPTEGTGGGDDGTSKSESENDKKNKGAIVALSVVLAVVVVAAVVAVVLLLLFLKKAKEGAGKDTEKATPMVEKSKASTSSTSASSNRAEEPSSKPADGEKEEADEAAV